MQQEPFDTMATEDGARCKPTGPNLHLCVLGRRCPEAQEQQQFRAAMAPGWARGLRTARGTAEAGALSISVINIERLNA